MSVVSEHKCRHTLKRSPGTDNPGQLPASHWVQLGWERAEIKGTQRRARGPGGPGTFRAAGKGPAQPHQAKANRKSVGASNRMHMALFLTVFPRGAAVFRSSKAYGSGAKSECLPVGPEGKLASTEGKYAQSPLCHGFCHVPAPLPVYIPSPKQLCFYVNRGLPSLQEFSLEQQVFQVLLFMVS